MSSAEEDGGTWDLTSDPHVTRSASTRLSRTNSYSHFADDESSESSTAGFSDGCGIQGTFPSAERLRVRWAIPLKTVDVPNGGDGRRRVGVREAKAEMTCVVLGKGKNKSNGAEGVVMNVEYKGTCKGVWFPGVATLLGMDVGLEAKGSDVTWITESEPKWSVGGGLGYTGFDMGVVSHAPSKQSSADSGPHIFLSPSSPPPHRSVSRQNSTSSLLRAPLPAQNVPDYSFEGSATSSTPSGTISSVDSLPISSTPNIGRKDSTTSINGAEIDPADRPPGAPITIHVNMNDLLPPSKNIFTFTVSGTILVSPRPRSYGVNSRNSSPAHSDNETDPEAIVLPRFTVLAADAETTTFLIRNEVALATVEVYNSSGDIRDAQTRKTVLQKGGFTRCGSDGGRIALRSFRPPFESHRPPQDNVTENGMLPLARFRPPGRVPSPSSLYPPSFRPRRDGPLMIPSVEAIVTPLLNGSAALPDTHAVRLSLPAPCDSGSEWLEFGFAQQSQNASTGQVTTIERTVKSPRLQIAGASIDGVPVRFETSTSVKEEPDGVVALRGPFEEIRGKDWVSWVKVYIGGRASGNVVIDYVVTNRDSDVPQGKGKGKNRGENCVPILLPTFSLPVGRLEVNVEANSGIDHLIVIIASADSSFLDLHIISLQSNLAHQHGCRRLLQYSMEELFHPSLSLTVQFSSRSHQLWSVPSSIARSINFLAKITPAILSLIFLFYLVGLDAEIRQLKRSLETYSTLVGSGWDGSPETVTITTTLPPSTHSKWWFGDTAIADPTSVTSVTSASWSSPTSSAPPSLATVSGWGQTIINPESSSISGAENNAILPFDGVLFPWLIGLEIPPPAQVAFDKVLEGLTIVWQAFRKVYHYPLDPPS